MLLLSFLACRLPAFGGCFRSAIGLSSKYMFSVDSWFEGFAIDDGSGVRRLECESYFEC
ncbi:hypothetical protein HanHA300_Chr02g0048671 [Helianthus annuus]|nr:hypothetical protein HanHA300_Chr02g0048671 [Helianthus annuus]KAJ0776820.1 hypothetical protein HanLR1_Chr02g0050071 [Helianthus annuus]